uniref:Putative ionotropic receptor ligand binding domain-containing protein n=1 Tax=Anopheles maculatus TaxID=74869 RepID=A0A182SL22_9DIPT
MTLLPVQTLIALLVLRAAGTQLELDTSNPNQLRQVLPELISSMLMRYFRHPYQPIQFYLAANSAVHHREQWDLLNLVLRYTSGHCTVTFANVDSNAGPMQQRTHAILFGEDVNAFERLLANFSTAANDYSGRYLLVLTNSINQQQQQQQQQQQHIEWNRLFGLLWSRHIVNVNVLLVTANGTVQV